MWKIEQGLGGTINLDRLSSGNSTGDTSVKDDVLLNTAYRAWFSAPIDDDLMEEVYQYALQNSHETILKISERTFC